MSHDTYHQRIKVLCQPKSLKLPLQRRRCSTFLYVRSAAIVNTTYREKKGSICLLRIPFMLIIRLFSSDRNRLSILRGGISLLSPSSVHSPARDRSLLRSFCFLRYRSLHRSLAAGIIESLVAQDARFDTWSSIARLFARVDPSPSRSLGARSLRCSLRYLDAPACSLRCCSLRSLECCLASTLRLLGTVQGALPLTSILAAMLASVLASIFLLASIPHQRA
jgi:hypothetical protein